MSRIVHVHANHVQNVHTAVMSCTCTCNSCTCSGHTYIDHGAQVFDVVLLSGNQLFEDKLSVLEHAWVRLCVCVVPTTTVHARDGRSVRREVDLVVAIMADLLCEGGREGGRKGGTEGGREKGREEERQEEKEGKREGGREVKQTHA